MEILELEFGYCLEPGAWSLEIMRIDKILINKASEV
jgi:hypothetical protein